MVDTEKIWRIAENFTEGTDLFVVCVKTCPGGAVEVILDSDTSVSIDKCVELSRTIDSAFDRDVEDFELTVASAGIGRPLTLPRQFANAVGKDVETVTRDGGKFVGKLTAADAGGITLEYSEKQAVEGKKRKQTVEVVKRLPMDDVKSVKLWINFR